MPPPRARTHVSMTTKTLRELAAICGASLEGDGDRLVTGPASLAEAGPTEVSFLANPRYESQIATTAAAAVIVAEDYVCSNGELQLLRCEDPNSAFTEVVRAFAGEEEGIDVGVHPSAVVEASAEVHGSARVGPLVYIGAGARLGRGAVAHAGVVIEARAEVGEETVLQAGVRLLRGVTVGARCFIGAGSVLGSEGFGFDRDGAAWVKVPQCGTVSVADDVEMGANVTIDRARFGTTRIGQGAKLDNLVHVGHNSFVGTNAMLIAQVGLAGSCRVEEEAILAGRVGVVGHITVGAGARIAGGSIVWSDLEPGGEYMGIPARPKVEHLRAVALSRRLPSIIERIRVLEARSPESEGEDEAHS